MSVIPGRLRMAPSSAWGSSAKLVSASASSTTARSPVSAARTQSRLSLMMVDVDDFKTVNTRFGHPTGDRVLRELALLLKTTFRASDFVVRYGGDEFVVVMTETGEGEAEVAEARLRLTVEHWNQRQIVPGWELHLSCGTVQFRGGMTAAELIAIADDRMYEKKNAERDALALA